MTEAHLFRICTVFLICLHTPSFGLEITIKCIFSNFCLCLSLHQTVWQPYRLSHINALSINLSYPPKDQSLKFSLKDIENWRSWKSQFFWVSHFILFFASSPWKSVNIYGVGRMGQKFDDYPGFQSMRSWANTYAQDCSTFIILKNWKLNDL